MQLEAEMWSLERQAQHATASAVAIRVEAEEEESDAQTQPWKKRLTLGSLLQQKTVTGAAGPSTIEERAEAELTAYCQEPVVHGDEDPLLCWKLHNTRFPLMSRVARKYLCMCATSTPSERVFSRAGKVANPVRSFFCSGYFIPSSWQTLESLMSWQYFFMSYRPRPPAVFALRFYNCYLHYGFIFVICTQMYWATLWCVQDSAVP